MPIDSARRGYISCLDPTRNVRPGQQVHPTGLGIGVPIDQVTWATGGITHGG